MYSSSISAAGFAAFVLLASLGVEKGDEEAEEVVVISAVESFEGSSTLFVDFLLLLDFDSVVLFSFVKSPLELLKKIKVKNVFILYHKTYFLTGVFNLALATAAEDGFAFSKNDKRLKISKEYQKEKQASKQLTVHTSLGSFIVNQRFHEEISHELSKIIHLKVDNCTFF